MKANHLEKAFADQLIFQINHLEIYKEDRIGLIGANGSGKTTLLQVLAGQDFPDQGTVARYVPAYVADQFGAGDAAEEGEVDLKLQSQFAVSDKADAPVLSGGEETRLKLARIFSGNKPEGVYFFDEPTSHLDAEGLAILREKLDRIETFVLISHDAWFLNRFCNAIWEIKNGGVTVYPGNYDTYKEQLAALEKKQGRDYEKYQSEKKRLQASLSEKKKSASRNVSHLDADRYDYLKLEHSQKKSSNAVKQIQSRLDQLEEVDRPEKEPDIRMDFSLTNPPRNKIVISAEQLSYGYPGKPLLFNDASFIVQNGDKIALTGPNGSGKTTLLRLIEGKQDSIYMVPKAKIGYFRQDFSHLRYEQTILENVLAESIQTQTIARIVLSHLQFKGSLVYKKVADLSGGEQNKVAFAKLLVSDANILLLDEPTNFLDIYAIEGMARLLEPYEGTVLFVSHNADFVERIATKRFLLENGKIMDSSKIGAGQVLSANAAKKKETTPPQEAKADKAIRREKLLLDMRVAHINAQIAKEGNAAKKAALEEEVQDIFKKLRELPL